MESLAPKADGPRKEGEQRVLLALSPDAAKMSFVRTRLSFLLPILDHLIHSVSQW